MICFYNASFFFKYCRLNKLKNSFNLLWSLFEIPISILKSHMTIKFLYDSLALLNELDSSLKKWTKFWELGDLWILKQMHFILELVHFEHMHSRVFYPRCVCLLQIKPFLTNSSKLPLWQSLSFLAVIHP